MSDERVAMDTRWGRAVIQNPPARPKGDWKHLGACGPVFRETGEDWWYGPELEFGEGTQIPKPIADKARKICRNCPVRALCLMDAVRAEDPQGIWGGLTPYQRTRITRQAAAKAA